MRRLCFAWRLVWLAACACGCGESGEVQGVRQAFEGYIDSILEKRGEDAERQGAAQEPRSNKGLVPRQGQRVATRRYMDQRTKIA